ncbi:MAG: glycogen/starch synthase [Edaphocola sp.]
MQVLHLSAECYPVAKVGGLGDVVGALPKYQCQLGVDAKVIMPWYNKPFVRQNQFYVVHDAWINQGGRHLHVRIFKEQNDVLGFDLFLVMIDGLLDRDNVYAYHDESEQFIAFQHAVCQWVNVWENKPDVIHCHDHHVGLVPFMLKYCYDFPWIRHVKTVGTVHNGQYQGVMGWDKAALLPAFDSYKWGYLDWNNNINSLAALIKCCDGYTTVSPGYLQEIFSNANGLEALFAAEWAKARGIVNGIDTEVWNTETDPMLQHTYTAKNVDKGKLQNKKALCETFGLDDTKPLFSFIGRLVEDKGADLLYDIFASSMYATAYGLNAVILGSGSHAHEEAMRHLQNNFGGHIASYVGYNESLAHKIYAASDFLIMPSRVEPCGLNQLYAMRYGTIPVVHRIGGLGDTVKDFGEWQGYGICFSDASVYSAAHAIARAVALYQDKKGNLPALRKKVMSLDFSWERSAKQYNEIYEHIK